MNGRPAHASRTRILHPGEVTRVAALCAAITVGGPGAGCIQIDGGAVELSWSLRSFDGASVAACSDVRIRDVRLCWEPLADGSTPTAGETCQGALSWTFPCDESSGVTGFSLPPGSTAFWIEPVCTDGASADAGTYQVPPPIVRMVEDGKIVSLNSLLLVVSPPGSDCPSEGCTCQRP